MIIKVIPYKFFIKSLTGRDYFDFINYKIFKLIKHIIPKKVIQFNKTFYLKSYASFYSITKFNFNCIDYISNHNIIIKLLLPYIIRTKHNLKFYNKLLLFELPIITSESTLLINGVKRTLLSKLIRKQGIYYTSFIKESGIIYQAQLIFDKGDSYMHMLSDLKTLNIIISYENWNINVNFIYLLYFSGFFNKFILINSRYGNTLLLKTILNNSYYNYIKWITTLKNFYEYKNIIKSFILLIRYKLNFKYLKFTNFINTFLINILDILLDLNFNKRSLEDKDHFGYKKYNSLENDINNNIVINIKNFIKLNFVNKTLIKIPKILLFKEQFLLNSLLRITEDTNSIAVISNSLKIQNSGVLNLSSINTTSLTLRDFRFNQLGKFCILHTSEGSSSGLILSLTINTFNNFLGTLKSPFYKFLHSRYNTIPINLEILEQEQCTINVTDNFLKKEFPFNIFVVTNILDSNINYNNLKVLNTLYINIEHLIGPSENLIPFLNNNEPIRCIMGAKMQTQALPLIYKNVPIVLSGYEHTIPNIYSESIKALQEGIVMYVSFYKIIIKDIFNRDIIYYLSTYLNSNSKNIKYYTPLVWVGERVSSGQLLVETNCTKNTELSIGNSAIVLYGTYFGYEYEDSIIISEQLLYNNIFTSLQLDIYESYFEYQSSNIEISTLKLPDCSLYKQQHLNNLGIAKEGYKIAEGDVVISKVLKKDFVVKEYSSIFSLILFLFGKNLINIYNVSEIVKKGNSGRIIKTELFLDYNNNLKYLKIRVFISKLRVIELGDKLCGRFGNKGVISYISKQIDLPFTKHNIIPDIVTSSLGVPSRMNVGQLYEGLLGLSCMYLDSRAIINNNLNTLAGNNYLKIFIYEMLYKTFIKTSMTKLYNSYIPGKFSIRDGRSGNIINNAVFLGVLQYYKLLHMVKDKINYRTIGKNIYITQQPIRGRLEGGQRFGEMEVWALEAFGVAYTIKELFNFRSDDTLGKKSLFNMLINGVDIIDKTNISETFKIILKELKSLALNIDLFVVYPNFNYNKYSSKIY